MKKNNKSLVLKSILPSAVSILGILPALMLLDRSNYNLLPWILVFQLTLDDLDGWLARYLGVASSAGKLVDETCDVIFHTTVLIVSLYILRLENTILFYLCPLFLILRYVIRNFSNKKLYGVSSNQIASLFVLSAVYFPLQSFLQVPDLILIFLFISLLAIVNVKFLIPRDFAEGFPKFIIYHFLFVFTFLDYRIAILFFGMSISLFLFSCLNLLKNNYK